MQYYEPEIIEAKILKCSGEIVGHCKHERKKVMQKPVLISTGLNIEKVNDQFGYLLMCEFHSLKAHGSGDLKDIPVILFSDCYSQLH